MKKPKNLWTNEKWHEFSHKVNKRDDYKCLQCGRNETEVILQVHHERYIPNKAPWEYALSDCITLCKGCHARQHGLIELDRGWSLISIDDLGDLDGICERNGCGSKIRYEHLTYHPNWGYKIVGSTCIEYLTQKDRLLSNNILKEYKSISKYVHESKWKFGNTKKGYTYLSSKYKHHSIRIYGESNNYSFQIIEKVIRKRHFHKIIKTNNKSIDEVKEQAFIVLKGIISNNEEEKALLRNLYKKIK